MDVEPPFQAVDQHFQVKLSLRGEDGLVKFRINAMQKGGVFLVKSGKARPAK